VAETKEQAYRDLEYGIEHWFRYFQQLAAFPQTAVVGNSIGEMIEFINDSGLGAIGTPEACAAQIAAVEAIQRRVWRLSLAGAQLGEPGSHATRYELIAREAMPQFPGHAQATRRPRLTPARRPAKERCHTFNFFWRWRTRAAAQVSPLRLDF
jgi:limonene 1,2-monooxygenase